MSLPLRIVILKTTPVVKVGPVSEKRLKLKLAHTWDTSSHYLDVGFTAGVIDKSEEFNLAWSLDYATINDCTVQESSICSVSLQAIKLCWTSKGAAVSVGPMI